MARPPAWRLEPGAYPHHETIQTRFQDLDVLGHINNVAFAALFDSGGLSPSAPVFLLQFGSRLPPIPLPRRRPGSSRGAARMAGLREQRA
ncbi:MAG: hypothetical protein A4S16_14285 [Proteobacteria bacterium SG_bin6]|nr:MAG: hypothetical protein A4S16_14285 [Proteobacteria bacterium SG_bin6]